MKRVHSPKVWPLVLPLLVYGLVLLPAAAPSRAESEALVATESGETIPGIPWTGGPGITETVEQIMARERKTPPIPEGLQIEVEPPGLRPTTPRDNSLSPKTSHWPPTATDAPATEQVSSPQAIGLSFATIGFAESNFIPPDTMGDVGPTQILSSANGRIKVFSKATGAVGGLNVTMNTFFGSVRNGFNVSDPRLRYDRLSGRWFVVAINTTAPNRVLIAVSNASTITNTSSFTFFQFQHDLVGTTPNPDTGGFLDYPSLGVDKNALYIGGDVFNAAGTALIGTTGFVVNKANLLGATLTVTAFRQLLASGGGTGPWAPQGVDDDDPGATEGYFIGPDNATYGTLILRRVTNPGATPSISGNISLTVPLTSFPMTQQQKGSATNIDALDDRLYGAAIHKNKITGAVTLWTAHNMQVTAAGAGCGGGCGPGTRNGSRWYEIGTLTTTPSLVQSGTLFDAAATNPRGFWMPCVVESGQGHMALGSSMASANDFAGTSAAGRLRTDVLGATQGATITRGGDGPYVLSDGSRNRWGDYSQTDVDPDDDQTIWTFQEYASGTNSWAIWLAALKAPFPATPASASPASVCQGLSSVSVTITGTSSGGTEFFDPGADAGGPGYLKHISATVTGGVVVTSTTFTDTTHVALTLSTLAATPGAKDVTVKNPDQQPATGTGILTILASPAAPSPANNGPVCEGATLQLSASTMGGATYSWTGPGGFSSSQQNPSIPNATPAASGGYSVTVTVGGCTSTAGTTTATVIPNGAGCSDADACTQTDTCQGGVCTGSNPVVCAASDPCHVAGTCNPATGLCSNPAKPDGSACDDANPCTQTDTCQGGVCTGSNPVVCTPSNQCHLATCDTATGLCSDQAKPDGSACNDANACTQTDTCQGGVCTGSNPVVCTASDQCHVAGTCAPGTGCSNPAAPDGTQCNDGLFCTVGESCQAGSCTSGAPRDCSSLNSQCTAGVCNEAGGACQAQPIHEGNACDDGNPCTMGDLCTSGACTGAPATPSEVDGGVRLSQAGGGGGTTTVTWNAAALASAHDVLRGALSELPVGPSGGDAAELCFDDIGATSTTDGTDPATGAGFWYLVRGENGCGKGPYGFQGVHGAAGAARNSATCP